MPNHESSWERHQLYIIKELERGVEDRKETKDQLKEMALELKAITIAQADLKSSLRRTVHVRSSIVGAISGFLTVIGAFFFEIFHRR